MKKIAILTAILALSTVTASAADLAPRYAKAAPPMMAAPVFTWTGCYVGVHAGAGGMHDSWTGEHGNGGLAGGQGGCNYQTGMLVFGAEGEGYWSGIRDTFERDPINGGRVTTDRANNKYDYSIAARMGIAFDRALVYGKAGWVWGKFDFDHQHFFTESGSATLNGLLVGVGLEYAFTNNWTAKFEYNYLNYGSKPVAFTECNSSGTNCFLDFSTSQGAEKHIFKVGINYLFGGIGKSPIVAKY